MAVADLRQHSLRVLDANQVVCTDGPPHSSFTQVLVLVFAQPGDGLETNKHKAGYNLNNKVRKTNTQTKSTETKHSVTYESSHSLSPK